MASQLWHLGKGSQGPVDLGIEPTEAERRPYAIHQSGKWYTNENIDQMRMERHLNKKARRSSHKNHMKGCTMSPVDIVSAPTGVATETRESVQKMMMYASHSPLKNLY